MKNLIAGLLTVAAVSVGAQATAAEATWTYLGGAMHLPHCQQIAGAYGYLYATYGGYVNGVYVFNACFGSNGAQDTSDIRKYDIYSNDDLTSCAADVEWQLGLDVRCEAQIDMIRCVSRRGGVKTEIENVDCVNRVYVAD